MSSPTPSAPQQKKTITIETYGPSVLRKYRWHLATAGGALLLGTLAWIGWRAPLVGGELWTASVISGDLHMGVGGHGRLIPSGLLTLSSTTGGSVAVIHALSGLKLSKGDPVVTLQNPDLLYQLNNAEKAYTDKLGEQAALQSELMTKRMELQSKVDDAKDNLGVEILELNACSKLVESNLIAVIQLEKVRARATAAKRQLSQAEANLRDSELNHKIRAKIMATAVGTVKAQLDRVRRRVDELTIRAQDAGVLYELMENITVGTPVAAGTVLGKIATQTDLSADIQVPSSRAWEIKPGQSVDLQVGDKSIQGEVERIDPRVQQDQVRVSVRLPRTLPVGILAGQPVNADVITGRLQGVSYVQRPAGALEGASMGIFTWDRTNRRLERREVRFGKMGGRFIVVESGLEPGAEIVLSDMSKYSNYRRLRTNP